MNSTNTNGRILWVFGDSWSIPWERAQAAGHKEYVDKHRPQNMFADFLKDNLNIDKIDNRAYSGFNNYSILESIGQNISNFNSNDIVLIGWSEITRWRSVNKYIFQNPNKGKWQNLGLGLHHDLFPKPDLPQPKLILQETASRDSELVCEELNSWIKILKIALPEQTLQWTAFQEQVRKWNLSIESPNFKLPRITDETGITYRDSHTTEEGHRLLSEWMLKILKKETQDRYYHKI